MVVDYSEEWVYFIQQGDPAQKGPIKIGYGKDPFARLTDLQVGNPNELRIVALVRQGDIELENYFHDCFHRDHLRGEWFKASTRLLNLVSRINDGLPWCSDCETRPAVPEQRKDLCLQCCAAKKKILRYCRNGRWV